MQRDHDLQSCLYRRGLLACLSPVSFDAGNGGDYLVGDGRREDDADDVAFVDHHEAVHILFEISCDVVDHGFVQVVHLARIVLHERIAISCGVQEDCVLGYHISLFYH